MNQQPSLAGRAVLAALQMIGCYVLALAIVRTLQGLGDSIIKKPFPWYGKLTPAEWTRLCAAYDIAEINLGG
jgi:hypothetical protein